MGNYLRRSFDGFLVKTAPQVLPKRICEGPRRGSQPRGGNIPANNYVSLRETAPQVLGFYRPNTPCSVALPIALPLTMKPVSDAVAFAGRSNFSTPNAYTVML
jgi:hypothetical protein